MLPLHSSLPPAAQQAVFQKAPRGLTKVILSTNIAETSITIPDVTTVIDSGLEREVGFDKRGLSRLQLHWCSRSSVKQRQGRAGFHGAYEAAQGGFARFFNTNTRPHQMRTCTPSTWSRTTAPTR